MRRNPVAAIVAAAGLYLLSLGLARAAGTEEPQTAVKLYRGTSIIAASDPNHATYRAGFTFDACMALKAERWHAEADAKTSGSKVTYRCQLEERSIITFHPAPILTCPDRPAPDEQETRACPTGTVGAWLQDRKWTLHPYPTCWIQGDWTPAVPPEGMCAPVTAEQWTFCANEYATCSFTGTRRARFGLNSSWVERDVTAVDGGVPCRIATFGSDPLVGVAKRCELSSTTPEPDPAGSASLSWTPPTQNTDSTTLTNLAGYRISYGTSAQALVQTVQVTNAGASGYTIGNLTPGTYYFAVRAYTSDGTESANSNVVSKVVAQ